MTDVCPSCKTPGRKHTAECEEGVPNRVGYFKGIPVVQDLPADSEHPMLKSNPLLEPNQWHATERAVAQLIERGWLRKNP